MATPLEEFRNRHPEYDDILDDDLIERLWEQQYQDMPLDVLREKVGKDRYTEETESSTRLLNPDGTPDIMPETGGRRARDRGTALDRALEDPATDLQTMQADELEPELEEFKNKDWEETQGNDPGYWANIGLRAAERAFDVTGDLFIGTSKAVDFAREGDVWLAERGYRFIPPSGPDDPFLTEPGSLDRQANIDFARSRKNFFEIAGEHMKDMDFGSRDPTQTDELERLWSNADTLPDYANALTDTLQWGLTEGGASIPDMGAALAAAPAVSNIPVPLSQSYAMAVASASIVPHAPTRGRAARRARAH